MSTHKKSWVAKLAPGKNLVYGLETYLPDNSVHYYFVLVEPAKEKEFLAALEGFYEFSLESYGRVIAEGKGKPSAEVKKRLLEEHGATV